MGQFGEQRHGVDHQRPWRRVIALVHARGKVLAPLLHVLGARLLRLNAANDPVGHSQSSQTLLLNGGVRHKLWNFAVLKICVVLLNELPAYFGQGADKLTAPILLGHPLETFR